MASSSPAALLAFPNEVLDEILGHLVSSLPPEPRAASRKSPKLQALEKVSLVSKQWRAVALRRLVSKLVIRTGSKVRAITKSFESGNLGGMLRELRLDGCVYVSGMGNSVPTASDLAKQDRITPEDFVALLHLTPHLKVLDLNCPAFVRFRQRDLTTLATLPFAATLETLTFSSARFDRNCELIKVPRINTAPSKHPFLSALHLSGSTSVATLFSLVDITASRSLEEIHLYFGGEPIELDRIFKAVGPGLKLLDWQDFSRGESFETLITEMWRVPSLETLQIKYIRSVEEAASLFQHLPATVSAIRLPNRHGHGCEEIEKALRTTPKPPGLLRIELLPEFPGLPAIRDEMKTILEGHGLKVVCLE